jgi:biopolymer transport protein ExbB/TolQ
MSTLRGLEELIYRFSAALLYPALGLLIWYALRVVGHLGEAARDVVAFRAGRRRAAAGRLRAIEPAGLAAGLAGVADDSAQHPAVRRFARQLAAELGRATPRTLPARARHLANDFEAELVRDVDRVRVLVRIGPCLGLAATLIPLGPGLAALGQGDLGMLSSQLIVSFSATVVGLAIGGVGYVLSVYLARVADLAAGDIELLVELAVASATAPAPDADGSPTPVHVGANGEAAR